MKETMYCMKKIGVLTLSACFLLSTMVGVSVADDPTSSLGSSPTSDVNPSDVAPTLTASTADYGWVYGTVTDENGQPLSLASITIYRPAVSVTDSYKSHYVTYSGNTGAFRISVLPGTYVIDAYKQGYSTERETGVIVVKQQGTEVDFHLLKASVSVAGQGILTGTVYGYTIVSVADTPNAPSQTVKIPLKGARIDIYTMTTAAKVPIATAFTDGDGSYKMKLSPGSYLAIASKGLSFQSKDVKIAETKITTLDFILKVNAADVELDTAISTGNVGGELSIIKNEDDTYRNDVITYNTVTITPVTIESNSLRISVSGDEASGGKTIAIILDPTIMSTETALAVQYDGTDISEADSLEDVLNPNDDGAHPEFYTDPEPNGTKVYVTIPHFSEHEILIIPVEAIVGGISSLLAAGLFIAVFSILGIVYIIPYFMVRKSK